MSKSKEERKLTIIACNEIHRGRDRKDREFILREVQALDEQGTPIELPLRTFEELKVGTVETVTIEPYDAPGRERTYTLSKIKQKAAEQMKQMADELAEFRKRLEDVEQRVAGI